MSRISYIVTALAAIFLVSCKQSARYTLHEGTDPSTGTRCTLQIDESSGQSTILRFVAPSPTYSLHYWEPIHDQRTAMAVLKAYHDATNSPTPAK